MDSRGTMWTPPKSQVDPSGLKWIQTPTNILSGHKRPHKGIQLSVHVHDIGKAEAHERNAGAWSLDLRPKNDDKIIMSITLEFDEEVLAGLPLGPGERERHMQIELACRFYLSTPGSI